MNLEDLGDGVDTIALDVHGRDQSLGRQCGDADPLRATQLGGGFVVQMLCCTQHERAGQEVALECKFEIGPDQR